MCNQRACVRPSENAPRNPILPRAFSFLALLTVAALAAGLAAPAARAADSSGAAVAFDAFSATGRATLVQGLRNVPFTGAVDAAAPAVPLGSSLSFTKPHDGTTGFFIGGPIDASVSNGRAVMQAGAIINANTFASGNLVLDLVATTSPPPEGGFTGFLLASVTVGTLAAQSEIASFSSGSLAYTGPTAGCYYVSLVLEDAGTVVDVRTLPQGGLPQNTGYSTFGLGEACAGIDTCVENSNTVCLNSGRFQVTVAYDNTATGAGVGQVMLFGSTRAESDQSVFYYFTSSTNFELGAKILNACDVNNAYWIFIGGLTNQGWSLNVLDTKTQATKFYSNADGITTVTTTDTAALPCP